MSLRTLLLALATAPRALAHGGLANYTVGDPPVWYRGYDPDENATEQDGQPWMVQRKWASIDPIFSATDPFIACNKPGTPGPAYIPVAAGQNLTAVYWYWLHPVGPMTAWLAACPPLDQGGCVGVDVNGLDWFKIWEAGLIAGTGNLAEGIWYQKQFQNWDGSPDLWPVMIPATLKAGLYVVRHEILSIHIENKPQFYPECAHLNISGPGADLPPTSFYKKFPGAYDPDDPSLKIDIYSDAMRKTYNYTIPGGPVWAGPPVDKYCLGC
ncbi:hypothetical protein SCUCBS95973_001411 [Sporothrix curviconia]|uniref:lytic cellulose monooxygenase (C4-dehydrogenating) n=1 Tax=Sporothrix curviconia TaxID=1260050 RepID=A0ABP0AYA6_9PEZI